MPGLSKRQKIAKNSLYDIGYEYLRTNFRKFSQVNKIRVAIAVLSIFEKDGSKTKPEFHTHFTVILDGNSDRTTKDNAPAYIEAEPSISAIN